MSTFETLSVMFVSGILYGVIMFMYTVVEKLLGD